MKEKDIIEAQVTIVESKLKSYKASKELIGLYTKTLENMNDDGETLYSSPSFSEPLIKSLYPKSKIESHVLSKSDIEYRILKSKELVDEVDRLLTKLSPDEYKLIYYRYFHGWTLSKMENVFYSASASGVKYRIQTILKKLSLL
jgi:DNA-directed RNA polymerase specialized sigma subunit, sigma24 homolog